MRTWLRRHWIQFLPWLASTIVPSVPTQPPEPWLLVCAHLSEIYLLLPSLREAEILAGVQPGEPVDVQRLALKLVNLGVEMAIITLSEIALYYASSDESGRVPPLQREVQDLTGAADAMAAAVVFGLLNDVPMSEAVRLGVSAAALTVQCTETVCPNLSLERLYDELVI